MARLMKKKTTKKHGTVSAIAGTAKVASRTDVRNTPIPKPGAPAKLAAAAAVMPAKRAVSHDQIARRAYEIWSSGQGGSEFDNWLRAERELRG